MFSPSKDKIIDVYASIQAYFKIEDDGYLNKHIGIDMDHLPDGSIHLRQHYLAQRNTNMIPCMDKSSANPTPAFNPPLKKNEGDQTRKNDLNYISVIGSRYFLTNSMRPRVQFAVHQCMLFSIDPNLPYDKPVKLVLKYVKWTAKKVILLKLDTEKRINCYIDSDFASGRNKEVGKNPVSVLCRTIYVITYTNCKIIWVS